MAVALGCASACVGFNIRGPDDCARICDTAAACGFLPSVLGWSADGVVEAAHEDCLRRCANSPEDDADVATIVACFSGEGGGPPSPVWCASELPDDLQYKEAWEACAEVSTCLQRAFRDDELRGDVRLMVQLIGWSEYEQYLGLPLAGFPDLAGGDAAGLQSCQPALCSDQVCGSLECEIDDDCFDSDGGDEEEPTGASTDTGMFEEACSEVCELPEGELCDTRLCRVGHLTVSTFCEQLAVSKITIKVYERDRLPATEVFQDVEAGINAKCETSTFSFDPMLYELAPGPIKVVATVEGSLTGAALAEFGYFEAGEPFEADAPTPYCIEFVGPAMTVAAGTAEVVVPLSERAGLASQKGVVWQRCVGK